MCKIGVPQIGAMKKLFKNASILALVVTLALPAGTAGAADMFPDVNPNTITPDVQLAIESLAEQGIIHGFPDGTFGPNKSITRAQFAKILAQVQGLQPNPAAAAQFTDVKDPEQQGWVGALVAAGLTTGTTPTTYSPNRPIQRDQAATFLVRALGLEEVAQELNLTPTTTDGARINESHRVNVGLLEKIGLIKGYLNGSFGPGDPFKRQQAANLLYKIQQERDTYVNAAKSLLAKVDVVHNRNGTLTVKGVIPGAVMVDLVIRETTSEASSAAVEPVRVQATADGEGKLVLEQKGVKADENEAFEFTTSRAFVLPAQYSVFVTAYDAEGNVLTQLNQVVQIEEGAVQGLTAAPDLIHVYSEGGYVYYVFDEPIRRIEDASAFFVVLYNGNIQQASDVDLEDDGVTVKAEFYDSGRATLAGIDKQAVSDGDKYASIETLLPLNNVRLDGTTDGPDLMSVKVKPFKLKNDETAEPIVVEYVFEYDPGTVTNNVDAQKFVLFLKDGTALYGSGFQRQKNESVTVTFDVYWDSTTDTVSSGDGTRTSRVFRSFGGGH